jgi:hypothetical protein
MPQSANKPAFLNVSGRRGRGIVTTARPRKRGSDQKPRATKRETGSKCAGACGAKRSLDATAFKPKNTAETSAANTATSQACLDVGLDGIIKSPVLPKMHRLFMVRSGETASNSSIYSSQESLSFLTQHVRDVIANAQRGLIASCIPAKLLRSPSAAERLDQQDAGFHASI